MSDVVKLTTYVTDLSYRPEVYDEIAKAFGGRCPCSTGLVVSGLARKELLVEIECVAEARIVEAISDWSSFFTPPPLRPI